MAEEADTMSEDVGEVADGAEAAGELVYPGLASLGLEDTEQVKIDMNKIRGSLDDCNAVCRTVGARHTSRSNVATGWLVTGLVVSLAVLSSVPGGHAAKPRPQREVPYFPWQEGIPSSRRKFAVVTAADGSVWLFGGFIDDGIYYGPTDELFKLDPHERRWHNIKLSMPRPTARSNHGMVALNGTHALVFGGFRDGLFDELWVLDLLSTKWSLLGGRSYGGDTTYENLIVTGPSLVGCGSWGGCDLAMVALNSTRVLVFGGRDTDKGLWYVQSDNELWSLDVPTGNWTLLDVWHIGTSGPRNFSESVPIAEWRGSRPRCLYGHSMVALNSTRVLVFGGVARTPKYLAFGVSSGPLHTQHEGRYISTLYGHDELWSLDVPSLNWTLLDAVDTGASGATVWSLNQLAYGHSQLAYGHSMVALNSTRVLIFGGVDGEVWSLDVPTVKWTLLDATDTGERPGWRSSHRMVAFNSTRLLMLDASLTVFSDVNGLSRDCELWSLDLHTGGRSVSWTMLNLVNVTAEELSEQFNTPQVCACPSNCVELAASHITDNDIFVCRSTPGRRWALRRSRASTTVTLSSSTRTCNGTGTRRSSSVRRISRGSRVP